MKKSRIHRWACWPLIILAMAQVPLLAGPYSAALDDPLNPFDAPVPGFMGPDGEGKARLEDGLGGFINERNFVNPLFFGWAASWSNYVRADGQAGYSDPDLALGPVTGDLFDVVSLGDLTAAQIAGSSPVGQLTLQVGTPVLPLRNLPGADFVVFENALISEHGTGGTGVGGVFAELAYVEVSSDGVNFARFPSVSLTPAAVGPFGTVGAGDLFNLAGKHANGNGESWGTPFDLGSLATHPLVLAGTVNLDQVRFVRLVDIPGSGAFSDSAVPGHPIYDSWHTTGSGGAELEAIGTISVAVTFDQWQDSRGLTGPQRGALADPDGDTAPNVVEYACAMQPLVQDLELLPQPRMIDGQFSIEFHRDTRATQAVVEVLGTAGLHETWGIVARSQNGAAMAPVAPFSPTIQDVSASRIASVGVIRRQRVSAAAGHRLLRLRVSLAP
jgi:hypothetical protein